MQPAADPASSALGSPFPCGALGSPLPCGSSSGAPLPCGALGYPLPCSSGGVTAIVHTRLGASETEVAPADAPNAEINSCITESAAAVPSERPMQPTSGMAVGADSCDDQASRSQGPETEELQMVTGDAAIGGAATAAARPPSEAAVTITSGQPAGNVVGEQGALPDVVSELKARLARVEAARDELARQQGQYKGIIAKVCAWGALSTDNREEWAGFRLAAMPLVLVASILCGPRLLGCLWPMLQLHGNCICSTSQNCTVLSRNPSYTS